MRKQRCFAGASTSASSIRRRCTSPRRDRARLILIVQYAFIICGNVCRGCPFFTVLERPSPSSSHFCSAYARLSQLLAAYGQDPAGRGGWCWCPHVSLASRFMPYLLRQLCYFHPSKCLDAYRLLRTFVLFEMSKLRVISQLADPAHQNVHGGTGGFFPSLSGCRDGSGDGMHIFSFLLPVSLNQTCQLSLSPLSPLPRSLWECRV